MGEIPGKATSDEHIVITQRSLQTLALDPNLVKPLMVVLSADGNVFATVDKMIGATIIRLKPDERGLHHFIPLTWVLRIDASVHIDRNVEQATREWTTMVPKM